MRLTFEDIQPAAKQDVGVYLPYYQGNKRAALPYAISLYKQGNLEGERHIEGGEHFVYRHLECVDAARRPDPMSVAV